MRSLVGTGTAEDYEHGLRKNREISSDGPILDVRNVQILALFLRKIRTTGNLSRTSNTGLHQQTRGIQGAIAGNLVRQRRTRPNQRHIALQHVIRFLIRHQPRRGQTSRNRKNSDYRHQYHQRRIRCNCRHQRQRRHQTHRSASRQAGTA